jgi:hypothetical protein
VSTDSSLSPLTNANDDSKMTPSSLISYVAVETAAAEAAAAEAAGLNKTALAVDNGKHSLTTIAWLGFTLGFEVSSFKKISLAIAVALSMPKLHCCSFRW